MRPSMSLLNLRPSSTPAGSLTTGPGVVDDVRCCRDKTTPAAVVNDQT